MYLKFICMCWVMVCVSGAPTTAEVPQERQKPTVIPILSLSAEYEADGKYKYSYETGNGIKREETAYDKEVPEGKSHHHHDCHDSSNEGGEDEDDDDSGEIHVQKGSYSYTAPDGTLVSVRYIADENGFQPINEKIQFGPHSSTSSPKPSHESMQLNEAEIITTKSKVTQNMQSVNLKKDAKNIEHLPKFGDKVTNNNETAQNGMVKEHNSSIKNLKTPAEKPENSSKGVDKDVENIPKNIEEHTTNEDKAKPEDKSTTDEISNKQSKLDHSSKTPQSVTEINKTMKSLASTKEPNKQIQKEETTVASDKNGHSLEKQSGKGEIANLSNMHDRSADKNVASSQKTDKDSQNSAKKAKQAKMEESDLKKPLQNTATNITEPTTEKLKEQDLSTDKIPKKDKVMGTKNEKSEEELEKSAQKVKQPLPEENTPNPQKSATNDTEPIVEKTKTEDLNTDKIPKQNQSTDKILKKDENKGTNSEEKLAKIVQDVKKPLPEESSEKKHNSAANNTELSAKQQKMNTEKIPKKDEDMSINSTKAEKGLKHSTPEVKKPIPEENTFKEPQKHARNNTKPIIETNNQTNKHEISPKKETKLKQQRENLNNNTKPVNLGDIPVKGEIKPETKSEKPVTENKKSVVSGERMKENLKIDNKNENKKINSDIKDEKNVNTLNHKAQAAKTDKKPIESALPNGHKPIKVNQTNQEEMKISKDESADKNLKPRRGGNKPLASLSTNNASDSEKKDNLGKYVSDSTNGKTNKEEDMLSKKETYATKENKQPDNENLNNNVKPMNAQMLSPTESIKPISINKTTGNKKEDNTNMDADRDIKHKPSTEPESKAGEEKIKMPPKEESKLNKDKNRDMTSNPINNEDKPKKEAELPYTKGKMLENENSADKAENNEKNKAKSDKPEDLEKRVIISHPKNDQDITKQTPQQANAEKNELKALNKANESESEKKSSNNAEKPSDALESLDGKNEVLKETHNNLNEKGNNMESNNEKPTTESRELEGNKPNNTTDNPVNGAEISSKKKESIPIPENPQNRIKDAKHISPEMQKPVKDAAKHEKVAEHAAKQAVQAAGVAANAAGAAEKAAKETEKFIAAAKQPGNQSRTLAIKAAEEHAELADKAAKEAIHAAEMANIAAEDAKNAAKAAEKVVRLVQTSSNGEKSEKLVHKLDNVVKDATQSASEAVNAANDAQKQVKQTENLAPEIKTVSKEKQENEPDNNDLHKHDENIIKPKKS